MEGAQDKLDVTTHTDTTATFGTTLQSPGDSITYDITIENLGTIDAVLKTITKTDTSNSAILFETSGVFEGDELKSHETAKMQVTVTYNPSVTSQPSDLSSDLKVELGYEQAPEGYVPPARPITSDDLKALAVTEGDGLYVDEYESGKYTYKGANPNNYITFNNETWRIISISSDGTIKIMRNESIESMAWDLTGGINGSNDWSRPATLNTYLNGEYYNSLGNSIKDYIVSYSWGIGAVTEDTNDLASQIFSEKGTTWNGKVGLISASEYLRANTNTEECGTYILNTDNISICRTTNWMFSSMINSPWTWTISSKFGNSYDVLTVNGSGSLDNVAAIYGNTVSPALYLSSDITLTGTGTQADPYKITN